MTRDGQNQSFHAVEKMKMAKVAKIGMDSGTAMVKKLLGSEDPSIRAASRISGWIPSKKFFRSRKKNVFAPAGSQKAAY
ncbi:hypothetical protein D3C81_1804220 [compost metagenome]